MAGVHIGTLLLFLLLAVPLCSSEMYMLPLIKSKANLYEALAADEPQQNLHGKAGQGYYIQMAIGSPPQQLNVLVDTGSSNFAIAAVPHPDVSVFFNRASSTTFHDDDTPIELPYTQGSWSGIIGHDAVTMSLMTNITVTANIACITSSDQFFINGSNWQGILGMAYAKLAKPDSSLEPFFDSLIRQTSMDDVFSMQLCGTRTQQGSDDVTMVGTLTIGGISDSLFTGPMVYAPLNREWYYEIVITEIFVGDTAAGLDCKEYNFDKTIIDSGTTNLRLPVKVFVKVLDLIKKQVKLESNPPSEKFWTVEEMMCWQTSAVPWWVFPELTLQLAASENETFRLVLPPQRYMRFVERRDDNTECYKFAITSSTSGTVLGAVVMEGFYIVFDRQNKQIGFAKTTCDRNETMQTQVSGRSYTTIGTSDCAYVKPSLSQSPLLVVAYMMAALCVFCLVLLGAVLAHCQLRAWWQRRRQHHAGLLAAGDDRDDDR